MVGPDGVDIVPREALFEILRGLAIGLALADAFPGVRRRRSRQRDDPERAVLVAALAALVEGPGASRTTPPSTRASTSASR